MCVNYLNKIRRKNLDSRPLTVVKLKLVAALFLILVRLHLLILLLVHLLNNVSDLPLNGIEENTAIIGLVSLGSCWYNARVVLVLVQDSGHGVMRRISLLSSLRSAVDIALVLSVYLLIAILLLLLKLPVVIGSLINHLA